MINAYLLEFIGTFFYASSLLYFSYNIIYTTIAGASILALFFLISGYFSDYKSSDKNVRERDKLIHILPTYNPILVIGHIMFKSVNLMEGIHFIVLEILAGICAFYFVDYLRYRKIYL